MAQAHAQYDLGSLIWTWRNIGTIYPYYLVGKTDYSFIDNTSGGLVLLGLATPRSDKM